jgi:hypothetical protein
MDETDPRRRAAIERLKNRRSFGPHLVSYVVVNAFLVLIWAVTGAGYFWPIWIIGGWGIGLVMHAWSAFVQRPITEEDVQREIERGGSALG